MSERRYQGSIGKQKAIQKEMADYDMSSPQEFREALAGETKLPETAASSIDEDAHGERPERVIPDWRTFTPVLHHIEGAFRNPDVQKAEQYRTTEDPLDRLRLIREMSPSDAVAAIWNFSENDATKRYIASRLDFYQKLFQGTATKKVKESTWQYDEKTQQSVSVETTREELIDNADVTPDTIKVGLLRDMMFGEMIGTPELGIYKLAQKFAKAKGLATTHLPPLKGYHSGIHYGDRGGIGNYEFLRKLYGQAQRSVDRKVTGDSDLEKVEHKSVLTAARWLADAMDYSPSDRGPESPYAGTIEEAVAWAKLGDSVKKQFRGMRQKIQGVDLHNIGRFIGKSGDTRYDAERGRLRYEIRALQVDEWQAGATEKKQQIIERHSQDVAGDFSKQREEFDQLRQRLQAVENSESSGDDLQRKVETIFAEYGRLLEAASLEDKTNLDLIAAPTDNEQKSLIVEYQKKQKALERRYKTKTHNAEAAGQTIDFSEQLEGDRARLEAWKSRQEGLLPFRARLEELDEKIKAITDRLAAAGTASLPELVQKKLEARLAEVNERYEKRKSLAAKALDLHFQFNHEGKQYGSKPFSGIVDWVNYAPLGSIKRAHRMLRLGISEETIVKVAVTDIVTGKDGMTRADLDKVGELFDQIHAAELAQKAAANAAEQVANLDWSDPRKQQANQAVNDANQKLYTAKYSVTNLSKIGNILSRHNYELPLAEKVELSKLNTHGLNEALEVFTLEEAKALMSRNVGLPTATHVRKQLRELTGQDVSLDTIAQVAEIPNGIEVIPKCVENGFELDELLRFPFLISPLIETEKIL